MAMPNLMAAETHGRSERPDVGGCSPTEVQHCFGAAEYRCADDVTLFEGTCVWIDGDSVAAVAELHFAEAGM